MAGAQHPLQDLATRLREGRLVRIETAELDAVLGWVARARRAGAAELETLLGAPDADPALLWRVYQQLDRVLFRGGSLDEDTAAVSPRVPDDDRRTRFRRLMAAFHPDRYPDFEGWFTPRAQSIQVAYSRFRSGDAAPSSPVAPQPQPRPMAARPRNRVPRSPEPAEAHGLLAWLRERLGRVRHLESKILVLLLAAMLLPALVFYAEDRPVIAEVPDPVAGIPLDHLVRAPALTPFWRKGNADAVVNVQEDSAALALANAGGLPPQAAAIAAPGREAPALGGAQVPMPATVPAPSDADADAGDQGPSLARLWLRMQTELQTLAEVYLRAGQRAAAREAALQEQAAREAAAWELAAREAAEREAAAREWAAQEAAAWELAAQEAAAREAVLALAAGRALAERQVRASLERYRIAFERGDIAEFMQQLGPDPRENGHRGRDWFRVAYGQLFTHSERRDLRLNVETVRPLNENVWDISGYFDLYAVSALAGTTQAEGPIRFRVRAYPEGWRIDSIEY